MKLHKIINRLLQRISLKIKRLKFSFLSYIRFHNIRIVALTIGFPHSGSSLIGYLLTAHPNIIFSDEPFQPNCMNNISKYTLNETFHHIVHIDTLRFRLRSKMSIDDLKKLHHPTRRSLHYLLVPNQYQGRVKSLKVIGIKDSKMHTSSWRTLKVFVKKLKMKKIATKYIFTIRNPYDMVATAKRKADSGYMDYISPSDIVATAKRKECIKIQVHIDTFKKLCEKNSKIIEQCNPQDILFYKHEDMVENPKKQLAKLCDFLSVPVSDDYLNDCTSQVNGKLNKSRFGQDWTQAQKQEVMSMIEKHDFLSGYSWES